MARANLQNLIFLYHAGIEVFPASTGKAAEGLDNSFSGNIFWDWGQQTLADYGTRGNQVLCKENMGVLPVSQAR